VALRGTGGAAMTLKQSRQLPLGLYRIYWKDGGSSLAAVGMGESGDRWLAPTNWVGPLPAKSSRMIWRKIENVSLLVK